MLEASASQHGYLERIYKEIEEYIGETAEKLYKNSLTHYKPGSYIL